MVTRHSVTVLTGLVEQRNPPSDERGSILSAKSHIGKVEGKNPFEIIVLIALPSLIFFKI